MLNVSIQNMTTPGGGTAPNQFIIKTDGKTVFQSYQTIIAVEDKNGTTLDTKMWDFSKTTGKYRNQFLGETKKETERKIKAGIYKLANLNK